MEDTRKYEDAAKLLKVIGHPVRLTIIAGLLQRKSCVKEIWDCLGLPQATVSQHLTILKSMNILSVKKIGVKREYSVTHPLAEKIVNAILDGRRD